jgi:uncharacterized membrane protein YhaH (DUF805 family)
MKWFIKVLRQYADFNGRARRTEYWMFALFNVIFSFAWMILFTLVFALTGTTDWKLAAVPSLASLCYMLVMLLPGMAVAVRRLHDQGKSGWWLLLPLIPVIGGIWLFVLMVTEGQRGDNRYGPNPKTAADAFDRRAQSKSAGVTLTLAFAGVILLNLLDQWGFYLRHPDLYHLTDYLWLFPYWLGDVILLTAGIWLSCGKGDSRTQGTPQTALCLLPLAATLLFFLIDVLGVVSSFADTIANLNDESAVVRGFAVRGMIAGILYPVCWLLALLFFALRLFAAQNRSLIRTAATLSMVCCGIFLLWRTYHAASNILAVDSSAADGLQAIVAMVSRYGQVWYILMPVAYIVLIRTLKQSVDSR